MPHCLCRCRLECGQICDCPVSVVMTVGIILSASHGSGRVLNPRLGGVRTVTLVSHLSSSPSLWVHVTPWQADRSSKSSMGDLKRLQSVKHVNFDSLWCLQRWDSLLGIYCCNEWFLTGNTSKLISFSQSRSSHK